MAESLDDILYSGIESAISEMTKEGMSPEEIREAVENNIDVALNKLIDVSSKDTVQFMKEHMYEIALEADANDAEFLARQNQKWGKCFAASQTMYVMATEAAELYCAYIQDNVDKEDYAAKQYTFLSLQHLHGRACQEFLEILTLMRAGFADGAYARWRSMYELCCIAAFIKDHGEQIAKQYFEQSETDDQKYKTWTTGILDSNNQKIDTFQKIQDSIDVDDAWKKQYKLACLVNHASPQGTFKRLANGGVTNCIPVGRSDYGITTPAEHSAISLQWITATFLTLFPNSDSIQQTKVIHDWVEVIREMYFTAHDEIFAEIDDPIDYSPNKKEIE